MTRRRLLWIADAVIQTGFARVTQNVLAHLAERWDVHVLGINYAGDPHPYPYPIYPAIIGGDVYGVGRLKSLVPEIQPDVVVVNNDPWIVPAYLDELQTMQIPPEHAFPVVAYMPVDAANQSSGRALNRLALAVLYTQFGRKELVLSGYLGRTAIMPHGVDTTVYRPIPQREARQTLQLAGKIAPDAFIVGNVNRNQPRKRLDLTIQYFTEWWVSEGQPRHVYLYLHCANHDLGWNVLQLAQYYGINKQFIITNPNMTAAQCLLEAQMPLVYNSFDVQLSTTGGEGWGLVQHEGMACGIPQIVPEYAALGEWCRDAVRYVPVSGYSATIGGVNTIGGVPDREATVEALHELYINREMRAAVGAAGLARATAPVYQWPAIAAQFDEALQALVDERQGRPVGVRPAPRPRAIA